jgi:hypothetical protein
MNPKKITAAIATLVALAGGAQANELGWDFPNVPPHSTCAEIVSRLTPTYPRWMANNGFSLKMMLFDDWYVWDRGGQSKIDWSNCNAYAAGMMNTEAESTMLIHLGQLTKKGVPVREAMDTVARRWSADPLWESPRPIIPKYDVNRWTNKPYAQGTTP